MNRALLYTLLFLFTLITPAMAQSDAEALLQKTVSRLEKDGDITALLKIDISDENGTNSYDISLKKSNAGFYAQEDEFSIWFDGKTMWRGNDFGYGIEEIYISELLAEEKGRFDIIRLLKEHKDFSVSSTGSDNFTLTASNPEKSVEGISGITMRFDPKIFIIKTIRIIFAQEFGNISANVQVIDYKPDQKFDRKIFTCPVADYGNADIIDLR